jgi:FkbM family methyltransferase
MKKILKKILKSLGYQINKYQEENRLKIIGQFNINKLFDVGANVGQYSLNMREMGFNSKIISFEPLKTAYDTLKEVASKDSNWIVNNYALGSENGESEINVSENLVSSSILNMLPEHIKRAPESIYVSKQKIEIKRLDEVFNNYFEEGDNVMLKIDTQGYEKNVVFGAEGILNKIKIIQLEMSVVALYENAITFIEMINFLDSKGFELFYLENGFSDTKTGKLLQVDGLFINKEISNKF